ncbi:MAG: porin family protein [Muribaculaceae bacterium]|nr:porin family protein [Muribaculaceae bacterium]MDE5856939.1 porin family protein [Muribaculaceae bacterium]
MRVKLLLVALLATLAVSAVESKDVSRIEVELKGGTNVPFKAYHGGSKAGAVVGLDVRYNLKDKPFDVGVSFLGNWTKGEGYFELDFDDEIFPMMYFCNHRTLAGLVTAGYNLRRGYKVNPYAGVGIGVAGTSIGKEWLLPNTVKAVFVPKIGVELLYNFRLEVSALITRNHFNSLNFTLGVVFGGRPKKVKLSAE